MTFDQCSNNQNLGCNSQVSKHITHPTHTQFSYTLSCSTNCLCKPALNIVMSVLEVFTLSVTSDALCLSQFILCLYDGVEHLLNLVLQNEMHDKSIGLKQFTDASMNHDAFITMQYSIYFYIHHNTYTIHSNIFYNVLLC